MGTQIKQNGAAAAQQNVAEQIDTGFGSMTLSAADRAALLGDLMKTSPAPGAVKVQARGSEPEDLSDHVDLDAGPGPANVLQFRGGATYQSRPIALDASHDVAEPQAEGATSRTNFSSRPTGESREDSVARVMIIGRTGVSTRALAA